ncbi:MAG: efflux transporter periplasmic adaptor subunit [Lysobacterales bacterium 14-68-21]|jgi:HlyD family secretion protein|nr:MAG: efflux transporter periplasmic adaptor subunit [Xanthomonadales bacterium 15-68-25]OZB66813.1 MAG: efflux transporter periplasmic adaptor subunit [Xanthomonadales bacterium 14-68-21]
MKAPDDSGASGGGRSDAATVAAVLGGGPGGGRGRRVLRWILIVLALLVVVVAGYGWFLRGREAAKPRYQTAEVTRGNLVVTVAATGNLQPTNQVDVGSELSGIMESVKVDVNDTVKRGQVLAQLDVSRLKDQIANARGALAAARAQVAQTVATVTETRLQLSRLQRMFATSGGTVPAQVDIDTARAALQRAEGAEANARAAVVQAQASLSTGETNLAKASIRSPIDGVVLSRSIEPGQTVAASLQAPVLFTLAEDLSKMELQVDVDEADVGLVHDGQEATFTVDAYPGREYPAKVRRVGFGSQTKDGVVSYLTVLTVNNDDLSLRPGMTATAAIVVNERHQVLLVPSAALRFTPPSATSGQTSGSLVSRLMPRPPHGTSRAQGTGNGKSRRMWVLRNGEPVAVPVTVGASNGQLTEVTGGELQPGARVITESLGGAQ